LELTHLSELNQFVAPDHELGGSIPETFAGLTKLDTLLISNNKFSGSISESIATALPSLVNFDGGENDFTGVIPKSFGQIVTLQYLRLDKNDLTGTIPFELGFMSGLSKCGFVLEAHVLCSPDPHSTTFSHP
jgi:hypothetical protein